MGASNYSYTSPIMEQKMSDEYSSLVYVDEWGYGPDESTDEFEFQQTSIRDDVRCLLSEHLKGFDAEPGRVAADDYSEGWNELTHESVLGRYDKDQYGTLLGTVGRMVVFAVPGYYGNNEAIVVTPNYLWQVRLFGLIENREHCEIAWNECSPQERAGWATAIRTLRTNALEKELAKTYRAVIRILDEQGGFGDRMSFRTSQWTSQRYQSQACVV